MNYSSLAISNADDLRFGHSPFPVTTRRGLIIGGGMVYPELNFTMSSIEISRSNLPELKKHMTENGIQPNAESTFSKFFTEILELSINFLYVQILSKKGKAAVESGTIAPATRDQLKSVEKTYKMYSLIYPFFWIISRLDIFLYGSSGYVVMVEGRKAE